MPQATLPLFTEDMTILNPNAGVQKRLITLISGLLVLFIFIFFNSCNKGADKGKTSDIDTAFIEDNMTYAYGICIDSLELNEYVIKSGDNLSSIFRHLGFSANMIDSLCRASAESINHRRLRAGMTYATASTIDSLSSIHYIIFAKSLTDFTVIDISGNSIKVYDYLKEVRYDRKYIEGEIKKSSLWNIIKAQGEDPLLALKISDILAWQIDFFDIKDGDSFRVSYDVAYIDDTTKLNIAYIQGLFFNHQGKEFSAFVFKQDNVMEYFDKNGKSLRKAFLKAPLDFFRISSKFTNARYHPILKKYRAHHGVDYAAPTGTPVKTIGNGTVVAKGYDSRGGGNYIKVKHNSVYTTTYMHLSKFGKGIQNGVFVNQGTVIGYVGSTGLSTGPHLDFRVHKNGNPINPLQMESPPGDPVKSSLRDSFNITKERIMTEMDSLKKAYHNKNTITENQ
jgi:murein DD-endopeptidase MepM/ murein hydrolase activator NlpD